MLPEGTPLQQGATYLNLGDTNGAPFTAHGEMIAGSGDLYIPKADTDYVLWNRLTGITTPERIKTARRSTEPPAVHGTSPYLQLRGRGFMSRGSRSRERGYPPRGCQEGGSLAAYEWLRLR